MTTSIKDNIQILKQVQDLDREIYQGKMRLELIPEEYEKLKVELELEKKRMLELEEARKKLQLKQKDKEGLLGQKETNVKKLEGQLAMVKTNKEYSALQQEIASLKADDSLLEEEIIKIMDEVEAAGEAVKAEKERLKEVEKHFGVREDEIKQEEKRLRDAFEGLQKKRMEIIQQVDPEIREHYDLLVKKKQGLALVKLNGENCGACRLQLRAQVINELQLGQSLVVCENCSRILYIEAERPA